MTYPENIDEQCIKLCDAINRIPGLRTVESCCGHGKKFFDIWFRVADLKHLPILLYYIDPCHVGFRWNCKVRTDCAMAPVTFFIESEALGQEAYDQADKIADEINKYLDERFSSSEKWVPSDDEEDKDWPGNRAMKLQTPLGEIGCPHCGTVVNGALQPACSFCDEPYWPKEVIDYFYKKE